MQYCNPNLSKDAIYKSEIEVFVNGTISFSEGQFNSMWPMRMSRGIFHKHQHTSRVQERHSDNLYHRQNAAQMQPQFSSNIPKQIPGSEKYECPVCNLHFDSRTQFQGHVNMLHREAQLLPFVCSYCQKGFFSKVGVTQHELSHKGYVFPCSQCNSQFTFKRNLRRHMETIHNLKECRYCGEWIESENIGGHVLECSNIGSC